MAEVVKVHPEASLRIVGGGECESALKRLTQQLSLEQNVVFTGMLKKEQSIQKIKRTFPAGACCQAERGAADDLKMGNG